MDQRLQETVFTELTNLLGDRITSEESIRNAHGAAFSYHACMPPDFVVFPRSTGEVAAVVQLCAKHRIPIIPFGAGTSVEGHIQALQGGVCIDMREMNEVVEVSYDDMYATIQAGVTRNQ